MPAYLDPIRGLPAHDAVRAVPLDARGCLVLAESLGDTPETVISVHALRRGVARAYIAGNPARFRAAIVENLVFNSDELTGFGNHATALWQVLQSLEGWRCVEVISTVAPELGQRISGATGGPVRSLEAIYYALLVPVVTIQDETVRLLTPADARLLETAAPDVRGTGFRSAHEMLTQGEAAAAIIAGQVVAIAHTASLTARHADLGVATLAPWRGRGLATAAASLVAGRVQAAGRTPVWSTGENNPASRRVAHKLGFTVVARRTYVIR